MAEVTIVSGPPGAGKTTLCLELCRRFELAVHLNTDLFFGAIRSGYILPWLPESHDQNDVCIQAAARAAVPYVQAGYEVFVDGVLGSTALGIYRTELKQVTSRIHFVVLLPSAQEALRRGLSRPEDHGVPVHVYGEIHAQFSTGGYEGHRLDSTELSVKETADLLLRERSVGRFLITSEAGVLVCRLWVGRTSASRPRRLCSVSALSAWQL
jgi:predicted ATPase